jgi:hypothetical protein
MLAGGAGVVVFDLGQAPPSVSVQPGQASRALRQLVMTLPRSLYAVIGLSAASDLLNAAAVSYAAVHLHVERLRWLAGAERVGGYEVRVTALKNKFAPPGQTAIFNVCLDTPEPRSGP